MKFEVHTDQMQWTDFVSQNELEWPNIAKLTRHDHLHITYTYCFDNKCSHIPRVRMPLIARFGVWTLSACTDQMQYWTIIFINEIVSELNISHMPPSFLRWETTWSTWTWSKLNSISSSCEVTLWYDLVLGTVPLLAKENHQVAKKHPTWDSKETPPGTVHPCTCTPPWMQLLSRWDDHGFGASATLVDYSYRDLVFRNLLRNLFHGCFSL